MSGEAAQQPASIIDWRSLMMVKLQTFTTVFLNGMEMKVSLTCVPCLGYNRLALTSKMTTRSTHFYTAMLPRVPHPTMWSLVDHLRPYAVFQYGADRTASAICSVTSVKKSEVTSFVSVVVYDVIVTSWSAYGGWSVYYD